MKTSLHSSAFVLAALIVQSIFATHSSASSARGDMLINLAAIRHQSAQPETQLIRIEGALRCDYASESNTGQGCSLRLVEAKTGKIFNFAEPATAMRVYLDGNKSVAIEGSLADSNTIQVSTISKVETL